MRCILKVWQVFPYVIKSKNKYPFPIPHRELSIKDKQYWIDNPVALQRLLSDLVRDEQSKPYLRHLESVLLAPTKGFGALAKSSGIFTGSIDPDFQEWGTDVPGKNTSKCFVDVHELARDGNCGDMFRALGSLSPRCLTQGQIAEFCCFHRESLLQDGHGTFFLFMVRGEPLVADIIVSHGELHARVRRFDADFVWRADDCHRVVVKHSTTK
jgi:hypothetical protein